MLIVTIHYFFNFLAINISSFVYRLGLVRLARLVHLLVHARHPLLADPRHLQAQSVLSPLVYQSNLACLDSRVDPTVCQQIFVCTCCIHENTFT